MSSGEGEVGMVISGEVTQLQLGKMQGEIDGIKEDVENLKLNQTSLEKGQLKLEMTLQSYSEKFTKIENGIENITKEVRGVSDKLLTIQVKDSMKHDSRANKKDSEPLKLFGNLAESNSKVLYIVIAVLGAALLFSMGMSASDITSFIK